MPPNLRVGKAPPHVFRVKEIQAPAEALWSQGEEGEDPSPRRPYCIWPSWRKRGWVGLCAPRALASPHGAASPTIPPARHLSIRAHKPGSETPASESSWGGGVPLPPHPWFLAILESVWEAAASRWGWGLWFRSQMEGRGWNWSPSVELGPGV